MNSRSRRPPTPGSSKTLSMRTSLPEPDGVTVNVVVTPVPVSRSTRPGFGSVMTAVMRRVWPPTVVLQLARVPAPTPPSWISKSENAGGRKPSGRWCSR
ncbi:MAG: hypothetical protein U0838_04325 [Chloroflexota bacterium]